jgi:hypothetical protein
VLFFLCKGTTCASSSLSGNVDVSKDLFIILEMGFATTDLDNLKILETFSYFFICFSERLRMPNCFIKGNRRLEKGFRSK